MNTEGMKDLLLHLLKQAYDQKAWHGPNLRGSLRGLSAVEAAWRPGPGRNSIWELALHCAYWKYTVVRTLDGGKRGSFPRSPSNFPLLPKPADAAAWRKDLKLLDDTHHALLRSVDHRLSGPDGGIETRHKMIRLIEGIACHDVYHAGQIRLLIRLSGAKTRGRTRPATPMQSRARRTVGAGKSDVTIVAHTRKPGRVARSRDVAARPNGKPKG